MTCLITGCLLVDEGHDRQVWGDLHSLSAKSSTLIFNAVTNPLKDAQWTERNPLPDQTPQVLLPASAKSFERRGVIVFDQGEITYNPGAIHRMASGWGNT